jgi:hypothetical protein
LIATGFIDKLENLRFEVDEDAEVRFSFHFRVMKTSKANLKMDNIIIEITDIFRIKPLDMLELKYQ